MWADFGRCRACVGRVRPNVGRHAAPGVFRLPEAVAQLVRDGVALAGEHARKVRRVLVLRHLADFAPTAERQTMSVQHFRHRAHRKRRTGASTTWGE